MFYYGNRSTTVFFLCYGSYLVTETYFSSTNYSAPWTRTTEPFLWPAQSHGTVYLQQLAKQTTCIRSTASSKPFCLLYALITDCLILCILQTFVTLHSQPSAEQGGHNKTVGDRVFPIASAYLWYSLPCHVTSAPSFSTFCSRLKSHLLSLSYSNF